MMKLLLTLSLIATVTACSKDDLRKVNKVFAGKLLKKIKNHSSYKSVFDTDCPSDEWRIVHFQKWNQGDQYEISTKVGLHQLQTLDHFHLHPVYSVNGKCKKRAIDCSRMSMKIVAINNKRKKIEDLQYDCQPEADHALLELNWAVANLLKEIPASQRAGCKHDNWDLEFSGHEYSGEFNNVHLSNDKCHKYITCDGVNLNDSSATPICDISSEHHEHTYHVHDHHGHDHTNDHHGHSHAH